MKNTIILSLVSIFIFESVPAQSKAMITMLYGDSAYYEFSKDWNHYQYEDIEWGIYFNIIDLDVLPPGKAFAKLTIRNRTDKEVEFNSKELKTIMITVDGKEKKFKKQTDASETLGKLNKRFRSFRERGGYAKRSCCLDKKELNYTSQAFFGKNLKADDGTISVSFNDKTFELKMNSKWEGKILKYSPGMKKAKKAHDKKVVKEIKALLKKK